MFFRSERLFLRPVWPEDWQAIHAGIADEAVVKTLARAPWPYREEDARQFAGLERDPHYPDCLILRPNVAQGAEVIGGIGLARHDEGAELGYWIARQHWGLGYAGEAARAMLALAQVSGHRRIVAHHFVDNPASGRVLARLGFRPTGAVVDQPCLARGRSVKALAYARELGAMGGAQGDCDDDSPNGGMRKRAA